MSKKTNARASVTHSLTHSLTWLLTHVWPGAWTPAIIPRAEIHRVYAVSGATRLIICPVDEADVNKSVTCHPEPIKSQTDPQRRVLVCPEL